MKEGDYVWWQEMPCVVELAYKNRMGFRTGEFVIKSIRSGGTANVRDSWSAITPMTDFEVMTLLLAGDVEFRKARVHVKK